ncbi:MAG: Rhodanese- sulfurtransferase [Candelina submexicana]|nr:MAG: Rhodanese- sulfurtransferase [Candelina submexicana]
MAESMDTDDANRVQVTQKTSSNNPTTTTSSQKPARLPAKISKPTPYTFDLGNLLCSNPNPLPTSPTSPLTETLLASTARDAAQALLNQLLTTCPITSTPSGVHLTLPAPTTPLPREKSLPAEKTQTKWAAFAAKKGIKDRKKGEGKMVYDEATGEWVPKWGYKGKNKEGEGEWLVEVDEKKSKGEEGENGKSVRGEVRRERKESVRRNERRMRANERRGKKGIVA